MSKRTVAHTFAYGNITLSTCVLLLAALYIYFVVTLSVLAALHQGAKGSIESVRSTLASLEETYLELVGQLDSSSAMKLGLVEKNDAVAYIVTGKTTSVSVISQ